MARKQQEMRLIVHWPQTELGWRIMLGRIAIFNELMEAQKHGETLNMRACIHQITRRDALEAYERVLGSQLEKSKKQKSKMAKKG